MFKAILLSLMLVLVSCQPTSSPAPENGPSTGGTDGSSSTGGSGASSTTPGWSFPTSTSSVQYAFMGLSYSYTAISGLTGGGWSVATSAALPAGLTASIVGTTAVISGIPTDTSATLNGLIVTASKAATADVTAQFTLIVKGDLLRPFQWHLENDGASVFSGNTGVAGEDMNVLGAWQAGYFGQGVRVAVSDSGLETTHPDLATNLIAAGHRNYKTGSSANGYLGTPTTYGEAHGTAVTGIIGAQGWNNLGGTGVAPKARVAGFQFIESQQTTSMMISQAAGDFDVFNYSYGSGANFDFENDSLYMAHLRDRVTNGRSGLGQIYVKAAGNEYSSFCGTVSPLGTVCAPQNANIPLDNNSPFFILVGAVDANGVAASYSNAGSNLWVSAPGGEYGDDDPAIVTTDITSCSQGFSTTTSGPFSFNLFERYSSSNSTFLNYNPTCDYTSTMNGTSSASPNTSGVVALMLSANPNLTWRDVKHILAVTADQVQPAAAATNHYQVSLRLAGHTYEQGWVTNAAGFRYHNWYGFGRVNASAAVTMAADPSYVPIATSWFESNPDFDDSGFGETGLSDVIPDADPNGVTRSLNLPSLATKTIESVQIKVQVTHAHSGQIGVELTSPNGTKSILLNINNALFVPYATGYSPDEDLDVVLTTHAFYGESGSGMFGTTWTVKLIDGYSDAVTGTLNGWSINVLGH